MTKFAVFTNTIFSGLLRGWITLAGQNQNIAMSDCMSYPFCRCSGSIQIKKNRVENHCQLEYTHLVNRRWNPRDSLTNLIVPWNKSAFSKQMATILRLPDESGPLNCVVILSFVFCVWLVITWLCSDCPFIFWLWLVINFCILVVIYS